MKHIIYTFLLLSLPLHAETKEKVNEVFKGERSTFVEGVEVRNGKKYTFLKTVDVPPYAPAKIQEGPFADCDKEEYKCTHETCDSRIVGQLGAKGEVTCFKIRKGGEFLYYEIKLMVSEDGKPTSGFIFRHK